MNLISKEASPIERLEMMFLHIYNFTIQRPLSYGVQGIIVDLLNAVMVKDPAYFGLQAKEEMKFYIGQLFEDKLLAFEDQRHTTVPGRNHNPIAFINYGVISFKGMQFLNDIERRAVLSSRCFVAMAFDDKKDERLKAINSACQNFGFTAFTVDEHHEPGNHTIDSKIILAIKGSRFCIVDFTGINAGAYMEAGYAMGRDKRVIFVCEVKDFEENKKHFDVNHYPFLRYSSFPDLTSQLTNSIGSYIDIERSALML